MKKSKFVKALIVVSMLATFNACKSHKDDKDKERLFVSNTDNDWDNEEKKEEPNYMPCHNGMMYWFYASWMMNSQGRLYPFYTSGNSGRVAGGLASHMPASISRGGFSGGAHMSGVGG